MRPFQNFALTLALQRKVHTYWRRPSQRSAETSDPLALALNSITHFYAPDRGSALIRTERLIRKIAMFSTGNISGQTVVRAVERLLRASKDLLRRFILLIDA